MLQAQVNNTKLTNKVQVAKGEIKRVNVCADCSTINTDNLIKIGGFYYCPPHAAARGYSGFTAKRGGKW